MKESYKNEVVLQNGTKKYFNNREECVNYIFAHKKEISDWTFAKDDLIFCGEEPDDNQDGHNCSDDGHGYCEECGEPIYGSMAYCDLYGCDPPEHKSGLNHWEDVD